ncbi:MAG: arylsulfatase [Bacteroidaceae bacterium]|nr:arylsulfatase [Bacteroidaceae bacterium]
MTEYKKNLFRGLAAGSTLLAAMPAWGQYSPTPPFTGKIGKTVAETQTAYPQRNPKAQKGAPNVIWVLLDDMGFGACSTFGGLIETPTFDRLAQEGLRFNNFHTTSISAPTRAAMLTGRNHHSTHVGRFNNDKFGAPGYDTYVPMENGTMAEILRENGYATFCVGKYNITPYYDASNAGPFNRWPTGRGFDHYYGYNPATAAQDQWHPFMYRDTHREPDDSLGRVVMSRLADEAINYIADQKSAAPKQPFFLYLAPGTSHAPHHASKRWIDKYKGKFDMGWDEYARRVLDNEIRMGVVPKGTKLPVRNEGVQRWQDATPDEQRFYAHQMEVYAAFVSECDYEIGRIVDFVEQIGQLDNTLIVIALGDNGAAGTGGITGVKGTRTPEQMRAAVADGLKNYDRLGDETTWPFYPAGWAEACSTPFRYYKAWADYEGGTHNGLVFFYPKAVREKGAVRTQYTHVIDILPTTVELTRSTVPEHINGYRQNPIEGISFAYAVESPNDNVADRKTLQYYELDGSYALYKDGWKVQFPNGNLNHRVLQDTVPHLYNLREDFNEMNDLAQKYPEKVKELLDLWDKEAWKYNVYPLKKGKYHKLKRTHYEILLGTRSYGEYPYCDGTYGKPFTMTVHIEDTPAHPQGILISQHTFALYLQDGVPVFATKKGKKVVGSKAIPRGRCTVTAAITYPGDEARATLYINDEAVGQGKIENKFAIKDFEVAIQVGRQWGVPVNDDYQSPYLFTGRISKAVIDIKK